MRKIVTLVLLLILAVVAFFKKEDIKALIDTYILQEYKNITLGEVNNYYRDYDFNFVQNTDNFSPNNIQDILNIYYTAINAGKTSFTFYCPKEYENCLFDIRSLANNQSRLSDINNYVHPFNGFSNIETEYDSLGRVTLSVTKNYSEEDIEMINAKVDELYPQLVNENLSARDNIKNIHDYIVNTTKYDSARTDYGTINYRSDIAYGPLFEGYGICGGYTDLMQLFLERLNIKSYRISSDNHIWNAIYLDNTWYHLDVTWDDPVATDGKDYLIYDYFIVDTQQLFNADQGKEQNKHIFDQDIYSELKGAY
ncbi:MAG: hypothetical protein IJI22_02530 [Bacilli bacterium]|nr:hypothetical protein [Bacilli bacterium]